MSTVVYGGCRFSACNRVKKITPERPRGPPARGVGAATCGGDFCYF